jgi:hypothetical protein
VRGGYRRRSGSSSRSGMRRGSLIGCSMLGLGVERSGMDLYSNVYGGSRSRDWCSSELIAGIHC